MKLIVFDMDGTLIDTAGLIVERMIEAFTSHGLEAPSDARIRGIIGLSLPLAMEHLSGIDDPVLIADMVDTYKGHYRDGLLSEDHREPLYPGCREVLDRMHGEAETLLGIATGKGLSGVHRILGLHGIAGHFATLQTPDHNPSKPDPGMLLSAMRETGAGPEQTVMVGDTVYDIGLGRAARVRTVGVSWGYHAPEDLREAGADVMIDRYDQLEDAISEVLSRA